MSPNRKRITCFFYIDGQAKAISASVDTSDLNGEAKAIQAICEENKINPYYLSFVMDGDNQTYVAEYLHSLTDFQSRKELIDGNRD